MSDKIPQFLTAKQVAEKLNISLKTVYTLAHTRRLKALALSGKRAGRSGLRFAEQDVLAFIRESMLEPLREIR